MAAALEEKQEPPMVWNHMAVRFKECIIGLGGMTGAESKEQSLVQDNIWVYNLHTEQWRNYEIHGDEVPEQTHFGFAVAVGSDVYMFGGLVAVKIMCEYDFRIRNNLWKLSRHKNGLFTWQRIFIAMKGTPSPRCSHSGFEYEEKMWIFGGYGDSPHGYLHENGYFTVKGFTRYGSGCNNQLLCYDPCIQTWKNPRCLGDVPSPRRDHSMAIIKDKVWSYGGVKSRYYLDTWHELNMKSMTWTQISVCTPKPEIKHSTSLTAISENELVLRCCDIKQWHGFKLPYSEGTWILDVNTHSWTHYATATDHPRHGHTGTSGLNSSVIVIGGSSRYHLYYVTFSPYNVTFSLLLEPKSLQQLAMRILYEHRGKLPLQKLPKKLMREIMGTEPEEDCEETSM